MLIGVLLAAVAWLLARESRELLIGRGADAAMLSRIRALAEGHEQVERLLDVASMYVGPHDLLLNIDLRFRGSLRADEMVRVVDATERAIRDEFPDVSRISIEARSLRPRPASADAGPEAARM